MLLPLLFIPLLNYTLLSSSNLNRPYIISVVDTASLNNKSNQAVINIQLIINESLSHATSQRLCLYRAWSCAGLEPTIPVKCWDFWDINPYNPLKVNQRFGGTRRLRLRRRRLCQAKNEYEASIKWVVSCLDYSVTLMMEAICSTAKSANFQRTKRRYIPEDKNLHNHSLKVMITVSGPSNTLSVSTNDTELASSLRRIILI